MGLFFLSPLILGTLVMVGAPWLIHQIRRPEREPVRFSSTMFIPNIPRRVIERRKLQHLLLLALRMLLLGLLVLAFSRPYRLLPAAEIPDEGPARHVIAMDVSYSMGTSNGLVLAKQEALRLLSSFDPRDRVGVIAFSRTARILAPLFSSEDAEAGTSTNARRAIEQSDLSAYTTAYLPAMQLAQELLLERHESGTEIPDRLELHIVTDLQKQGMPGGTSHWKLNPGITLRVVPIGEPDTENYSLMDVSVRHDRKNTLQIQGKIKNWASSETNPRTVRLFLGGEAVSTSEAAARTGNASRVSFAVPHDANQGVSGWLQIDEDTLAIDNRRYFRWEPDAKRKVLLVADPLPVKRRPSAWFLTQALRSSADLPWVLETASRDSLPNTLDADIERPDILIVAGLADIDSTTCNLILDYLRGGGMGLLLLNSELSDLALNARLLPELGLRAGGLRYPEPVESQFDLWSWVDFDHPVFYKFRGMRFNDFSAVRFFTYHRLSADGSSAGSEERGIPSTLARFEEDDGASPWPAVVQVSCGEGQALVWPFGIDLETTNIAKTKKFVPLLYESLSYLGGENEPSRAWIVGETPPSPAPLGRGDVWTSEYPARSMAHTMPRRSPQSAIPRMLDWPGFLRWINDSVNPTAAVEAVNINGKESDPIRVSPEELALRFMGTPKNHIDRDSALEASVAGLKEGPRQREYGHLLLTCLFALLIVECWYASYLSRRRIE